MYNLGRVLPPPLGRLVVWLIAQALITWKPANYQGALANLAHVVPPDTPERQLVALVNRLMHHSVLYYYHTFHNFGKGRFTAARIRPRVRISRQVQKYMDDAYATGRGLLIIGTHTSNFDLAGMALASYLPATPQVLSLANPAPGFAFVNELRAKGDGELTPISPETLRRAISRLQNGGVVMTAVDRPVAGGSHPVTFFGSTAWLPTHFIRIPLITDCLVMTLAFKYDGKAYDILANAPISMVRTGSAEADRQANLQRILLQIEDFVRGAPDQWMVFNPVWASPENSCQS
jgi:lauroyl/myristoyl acyltransferase